MDTLIPNRYTEEPNVEAPGKAIGNLFFFPSFSFFFLEIFEGQHFRAESLLCSTISPQRDSRLSADYGRERILSHALCREKRRVWEPIYNMSLSLSWWLDDGWLHLLKQDKDAPRERRPFAQVRTLCLCGQLTSPFLHFRKQLILNP